MSTVVEDDVFNVIFSLVLKGNQGPHSELTTPLSTVVLQYLWIALLVFVSYNIWWAISAKPFGSFTLSDSTINLLSTFNFVSTYDGGVLLQAAIVAEFPTYIPGAISSRFTMLLTSISGKLSSTLPLPPPPYLEPLFNQGPQIQTVLSVSLCFLYLYTELSVKQS